MDTSAPEERETYSVQGSAKQPYQVTRIGEVWSCSCAAWRNQSLPVNQRTCKHIRKIRGDAEEQERLGSALPPPKKEVTTVPPPLLLAERCWDEFDPTGWWMSEKLDGVRAYWDGSQLISRLGNQFYPPDWWTKGLPDVPLDGELYIGRKKFQETVSIVRSQGLDQEWRKLRYLVFDLPASKHPFEIRQGLLSSLVADTPNVEYVAQTKCEDPQHLQRHLDEVLSVGGEGVMLRQPNSLYEGCRSTTLLKVKRFLDDEAVVLGSYPGKGRHEGHAGGLELQWNGKKFRAGTGLTDKERENPPTAGTIVTFRYQELTDDGIPRFPVYVGVAVDKSPKITTALKVKSLREEINSLLLKIRSLADQAIEEAILETLRAPEVKCLWWSQKNSPYCDGNPEGVSGVVLEHEDINTDDIRENVDFIERAYSMPQTRPGGELLAEVLNAVGSSYLESRFVYDGAVIIRRSKTPPGYSIHTLPLDDM